MHNKFTQKAQNTLKNALNEAGNLGHSFMGTEHLLLGLAMEKDSIAARILSARGLDAACIRDSILDISGQGERCRLSSKDMTPRAKKIIEESGKIAKKRGCTYVGTEHILSAILEETGAMGARIVEASGVPLSLILSDLAAHQSTFAASSKEKENLPTETKPKVKSSGALALYSRDLTALSHKLDPTVGREEETERLIRILSRRTKNNPCLIGEPGVGKTAIVEGLAKRISEGSVPAALACKRILSLDIPSMIAGAKYRGEFEDRMKNVINEAQKDPQIILFIDELHVIVGAGAAEGAVDAANILKPALARGELHVIGATTTDEFRKHIQKDSALERRFQSVTIEEPSPDMTVTMLMALRPRYEAHHKVRITDEAIKSAVALSVRYINDRFLPDKAIDVLDEAAARCSISAASAFPELSLLEQQLADIHFQLEQAGDSGNVSSLKEKEAEVKSKTDAIRREMRKKKNQELFTVTQTQIASVITAQSSIPADQLTEDEINLLNTLRDRLEKRVVGQSEAIKCIVDVIRRRKAGISDPLRPLGSFLFIGSTGVGKSALAVALAEELMGNRRSLIRLDMSEFSEKHSISKLIGAPPGYVGFGEGGQLTENVRRRPYSVVLLDEIEKAHPDIFNLLLQVLEDGRLRDAQGREVSFKNTVIIMTSNEGVSSSLKITGFIGEQEQKSAKEEQINTALKSRFCPEFLSRIDETVIFNDLSLETVEKIAERQLEELVLRAESMGYKIRFSPAVPHTVAALCHRQKQGARAVRKILSKQIEGQLAELLLNGSLSRNQVTVFTCDNSEVRLQLIAKAPDAQSTIPV